MDSALLGAGIAAALAAAGHIATGTVKGAPGRKRNARQGRKAQSVGPMGYQPTNRSDLRIKPPDNTVVPRSVPRNVAALVAWDTVKSDTQITTSTSAVVETNFSFSLGNHPQSGSWANLFDQWCIPQVSMTFQSEFPPGGTTGPGMFYTALDFDNVGLRTTIASIEDFASCNAVCMGPDTRFTRSVRPCAKVSSTSGNLALTAGPQWVDSSFPGTSFFGIRTMAAPSGAVFIINVTITLWYAFRNQI